MNGEPNGDSSRVTNWQLYQKLVDVERLVEAYHSEMRSETRSLRQNIDEVIHPTLGRHGKELDGLRSRFVYALTIIGGAIGAVVYLAMRWTP